MTVHVVRPVAIRVRIGRQFGLTARSVLSNYLQLEREYLLSVPDFQKQCRGANGLIVISRQTWIHFIGRGSNLPLTRLIAQWPPL